METTTDAGSGPVSPARPLRLWPGAILVALQWLLGIGLPLVRPDTAGPAVLATVAGGAGVILWWVLFSRASLAERLGAPLVLAAALAAATGLLHPSIADGMMGFMPAIVGIPVLSLALVVWAAFAAGLRPAPKAAALAAAAAVACGALALIRTNGVTGDAASDLEWRWTPTPEERLLALEEEKPAPPGLPPAATPPLVAEPPGASADAKAAPDAAAPSPATLDRGIAAPPGPAPPAPPEPPAAWPGFRGAGRDSVVRGARIGTDWTRDPPVRLWQKPIGPGWSSFAVAGEIVYTQEQRGEEEIVSAYSLSTGAVVWRHRDAARFWESNAGPGPRGTPTLNRGRVYALGATGLLNALDARTGRVIWTRDAVSDTGRKIPEWGIAGSPLVTADLVVVAVGGWLAAYDAGTGSPRWFGPKEGGGYSSPHLATLDGVEQIVLLNGAGAIGVSVRDGAVLWRDAWGSDGIVQPAVLEGDLLLGSGSGLAAHNGVRRVSLVHGTSGWSATERWTSNGLKPYFNDFVVHEGRAFGFDGSILACIDLKDGRRAWKGGRYGHGQMLLLPEQDLLLVLSEDGELALVRASGDGFAELARVPGIEGKTWNHPVLVGDVLLVRNGEQMAAFRLPPGAR